MSNLLAPLVVNEKDEDLIEDGPTNEEVLITFLQMPRGQRRRITSKRPVTKSTHEETGLAAGTQMLKQ